MSRARASSEWAVVMLLLHDGRRAVRRVKRRADRRSASRRRRSYGAVPTQRFRKSEADLLTAVAGIIDDSSMIGLLLLNQGVADRFRPPLPNSVRRWRPCSGMPPNGCRDGPERMPEPSRPDAGIPPNECHPPEQTAEWRWQPIDRVWLFALRIIESVELEEQGRKGDAPRRGASEARCAFYGEEMEGRRGMPEAAEPIFPAHR